MLTTEHMHENITGTRGMVIGGDLDLNFRMAVCIRDGVGQEEYLGNW